MENKSEYVDLYRNFPGSEKWEGSFYEKLAEYGIWDENEFWKLHLDLTHIGRSSNADNINKELSASIVKIYVRVSSLIIAHFDTADIFSIQNLSHAQILAYGERLNMAIIGIFSGEVLDESSFELKNPFIK
ncbi:Imm41 family immunity protein [Herbaspirillum sp.]|uniref:Imm41 family immunity protein n=1 Tax=Herbaspirillum sp. TaxID=1890675 RepID=UPI0031DF4C7F